MSVLNGAREREEHKYLNLYRLSMSNRVTYRDPFPYPFTYELLKEIARFDIYSFLYGYLVYNEFYIKEKYNSHNFRECDTMCIACV